MRKEFATILLGLLPLAGGAAEQSLFDDYRAMFGDDNPAVFVIEDGADYWVTPAGPKQATLEACDLGLGPGVVSGAYVQLPRYFKDGDRVMDLEARLEHCMVRLQGRTPEAIRSEPYASTGDISTEMEALVTWIASESEGLAIAPQQQHASEQAMYTLGEQLFYYRAGPHDFSCATCHGQSGMRIRLQELPQLTTHEGAAFAWRSWPAYRISQGVVRTMGWRMRDCMRQQRLPELQLGSEASVALQTFIAVQAAGETMAAPGLKR